jgi:hypothetical protein
VEQICNTHDLRVTVRDAWASLWSHRIIEQARLEMDSNTRLRLFVDSFQGIGLLDFLS